MINRRILPISLTILAFVVASNLIVYSNMKRAEIQNFCLSEATATIGIGQVFSEKNFVGFSKANYSTYNNKFVGADGYEGQVFVCSIAHDDHGEFAIWIQKYPGNDQFSFRLSEKTGPNGFRIQEQFQGPVFK